MICLWSIILIFVILNIFKYKLDKSILTDFLVVIGPYIAILFVNNIIMSNLLGYYLISEEVQKVILFTELVYFFGSAFGSIVMSKKTRIWFERSNEITCEKVFFNFDMANKYTLFTIFLVFFQRFLLWYNEGFGAISKDDFSGLALSGLSGHMFISLYCIIPILFYEAVKTKSKKLLCSVLLSIITAFSTFVKYNVIMLILLIALYYMIRERKKSRKIIIRTVIVVIALFSLNYVVLYISSGRFDSSTLLFTINHAWKYIAGGTISMNEIVNNNYIDYSFSDFILESVIAIPNMFIYFFSGKMFALPNSLSVVMNDLYPRVSSLGEQTNVISFVGSMYSNGQHIVVYYFAMFIWGLVNSITVLHTKYFNTKILSTTGCAFIILSVLSFFGNYWTLTMPWEILIYSILVPYVFRIKFTFGKRNIDVKK